MNISGTPPSRLSNSKWRASDLLLDRKRSLRIELIIDQSNSAQAIDIRIWKVGGNGSTRPSPTIQGFRIAIRQLGPLLENLRRVARDFEIVTTDRK